MPKPELAVALEAVLFVAPGPVTLEQLAAATESDPATVEQELQTLTARLATTGLRLTHLDGQYRLVTAPGAAEPVRRFLQEEANADLSKPALETLAIVAYRGPMTKTAIEQIRGVASDAMIRNLLARGLIIEAGKSTESGRPLLYAISHTFLQHFGLSSPQDLPIIPEPADED